MSMQPLPGPFQPEPYPAPYIQPGGGPFAQAGHQIGMAQDQLLQRLIALETSVSALGGILVGEQNASVYAVGDLVYVTIPTYLPSPPSWGSSPWQSYANGFGHTLKEAKKSARAARKLYQRAYQDYLDAEERKRADEKADAERRRALHQQAELIRETWGRVSTAATESPLMTTRLPIEEDDD
jgi:hypothetical protein